MRIIPHKKFWLSLSTVLVITSVVMFTQFGLKLSSDFTEGTLLALQFDRDKQAMEVESAPSEEDSEGEEATEENAEGEAPETVQAVESQELRFALEGYELAEGDQPLGKLDIKKASDGTFIVRMGVLAEGQGENVLQHIREEVGAFDLLQLRDVSPIYAQTFRDRAIMALV